MEKARGVKGSHKRRRATWRELWRRPGEPSADSVDVVGRLGQDVTPEQVLCMTCLKVARLMETPKHEDSWVDIAGYGACGAEIAIKVEAQQIGSFRAVGRD